MPKVYSKTPWDKILFLILDSLIVIFSLFLALFLRLEGNFPALYLKQLFIIAAVFILIKIPILYFFRLYHISWEYLGLAEIISVAQANLCSTLVLGSILLISFKFNLLNWFPRSGLIIDLLVSFLLLSGFRLSKRIFLRFWEKKAKRGERILIVGAGDAGQQVARNIIETKSCGYLPVGFVDDDPLKKDISIHGTKVLGPRSQIPAFSRMFNIKTILIAIPSASSGLIKETVGYCHEGGISNIKILPSLAELIDGNVDIRHIQDIQPESLLGRQEIKINTGSILPCIKAKAILVTGAGGSIGSQLCRQIAALEPSSLIMVDIDDTELFYIDKNIKELFPGLLTRALIVDIKDSVAVKSMLYTNRPNIVFHAAAYKHVPMMEANARQAVLNNIEGTKFLAEASVAAGVEKFIFISTDKAINPTSVMGATKRACENMLRYLGSTMTKFISVRFGNVLESRGSIIPIIKEGIKKGGPVTITHPEMQRYFMSITEAAYLVLEAAAMCKGGETFTLDMGKPIKILDLAKEIIQFYGLEPDKDIPIVFTGIRPGEKLFEELLDKEEHRIVTKHKKIFITKDVDCISPDYMAKIEKLIEEAKKGASIEYIVQLLKELVPTYTHKTEVMEYEDHGKR